MNPNIDWELLGEAVLGFVWLISIGWIILYFGTRRPRR